MLRALLGRLRRWLEWRREPEVEPDGDTPEAAATRSGRRTVGY
jgi:hypothetical protein